MVILWKSDSRESLQIYSPYLFVWFFLIPFFWGENSSKLLFGLIQLIGVQRLTQLRNCNANSFQYRHLGFMINSSENNCCVQLFRACLHDGSAMHNQIVTTVSHTNAPTPKSMNFCNLDSVPLPCTTLYTRLLNSFSEKKRW